MLTVAICDDDGVIAEEIKAMLAECCREIQTEVLIRIFGRGMDLENTIREGQCHDLIYLDIQMDEQDGIKTAKRIRDMDPDVFIVFISSYDQFIEEIFDVNALNFIHKPIKKERLKKVLQQVLEKIEKRTQFYYLTYNRMTRKIPYQEIVFWESVKRQVVLRAISTGPTALAMHVAGTCRIKENKPWDIASVLFPVCPDHLGTSEKGLITKVEHCHLGNVRICLINYFIYKLDPSIVRVLESCSYLIKLVLSCSIFPPEFLCLIYEF